MQATALAELLPDVGRRWRIRRALRRRLQVLDAGDDVQQLMAQERFIAELGSGPIATHAASDRTERLPPAFFEAVLGPRMSTSCAWWQDRDEDLAAAEEAMLGLISERARLRDGQRVLELGCGWGGLALWIAERYPSSRVTTVACTEAQRAHVEDRRKRRGLSNLTVVHADMDGFELDEPFDRVVSIEMFDRVRNYEKLMARIARWLRPDGLLFVQMLCHRSFVYPLEHDAEDDWMSRHGFAGAHMPSEDLLPRFQHDCKLLVRWKVDGTQQERTARAWLANMDARRDRIQRVLLSVYGPDEADAWMARWRTFFLACAEQFGFRRGSEWRVCHYLFGARDGEDGERR
ncbi:MAG: SAM-dependent methyltransferase [Planctomycetota bacterium]|jgi:cyclopropane-fatty-acyl-phospholipid synthase